MKAPAMTACSIHPFIMIMGVQRGATLSAKASILTLGLVLALEASVAQAAPAAGAPSITSAHCNFFNEAGGGTEALDQLNRTGTGPAFGMSAVMAACGGLNVAAPLMSANAIGSVDEARALGGAEGDWDQSELNQMRNSSRAAREAYLERALGVDDGKLASSIKAEMTRDPAKFWTTENLTNLARDSDLAIRLQTGVPVPDTEIASAARAARSTEGGFTAGQNLVFDQVRQGGGELLSQYNAAFNAAPTAAPGGETGTRVGSDGEVQTGRPGGPGQGNPMGERAMEQAIQQGASALQRGIGSGGGGGGFPGGGFGNQFGGGFGNQFGGAGTCPGGLTPAQQPNGTVLCINGAGGSDAQLRDQAGYTDGFRQRDGQCGIGVDPRFTGDTNYQAGYSRGQAACQAAIAGSPSVAGWNVSDARVRTDCTEHLGNVSKELKDNDGIFSRLFRDRGAFTEADLSELGLNPATQRQMLETKNQFDAGKADAASTRILDPERKENIGYREGYACGKKLI